MSLRRALALLAAALLIPACGSDASTAQPGATATPSPLVASLHREVVTAMNYEPGQVELTASTVQIVVAVVNSNLLAAGHLDRDADAARIAYTLERQIEQRPDLARVQAIHVDYVARDGSGVPILKDSMDFRRSAAGRFVRDVT